jgi:peptidoglycan/xylan/chitin deacetylase (PgdA/CDA1 family)
MGVEEGKYNAPFEITTMKQVTSKFKRITKLSISLVYYVVTRTRETIRKLARRTSFPSCVVLHYHAIATEHRARFAAQMDVLKRFATPVTGGNEKLLRPGKCYAAVTFDDGFATVGENAVPELVLRQIPATIFVVADLLGARPTWDTLGEEDILSERLMSVEELRDLPSDLITIGSHGLSHLLLPSISEEQATIEICESKRKLGRVLSREVSLFSFPYGAFNQRLIDICRATGYKRVFTILPKLAFTTPQEFATGRIAVDPTDWPLEFRLKLLGAYRWLPSGIAAKRYFASWAAIIAGAIRRIGNLTTRSLKKCIFRRKSVSNPLR